MKRHEYASGEWDGEKGKKNRKKVRSKKKGDDRVKNAEALIKWAEEQADREEMPERQAQQRNYERRIDRDFGPLDE